MNEHDGPRGSGWYGPSQEIKTLGFRHPPGIPATMLLLPENFKSRWVCEPLRARNSKKIHYVVWDKIGGTVVWVGDNIKTGELLAARFAGWQEAATFPPKQELNPFPAPCEQIQLTEKDGEYHGPSLDPHVKVASTGKASDGTD